MGINNAENGVLRKQTLQSDASRPNGIVLWSGGCCFFPCELDDDEWAAMCQRCSCLQLAQMRKFRFLQEPGKSKAKLDFPVDGFFLLFHFLFRCLSILLV